MLPTDDLVNRMAVLIGDDTVTLGSATPVEIVLIKSPFTFTPEITPADVDLADFTGYAPIAQGGTVWIRTLDPETGDIIIRCEEPVGGFNWVTGDAVNLPQTIYGHGVTNGAGTVFYGIERWVSDDEVTLTGAGQGVGIPADVQFRLPITPMS